MRVARYYLVYPESQPLSDSARTFISWLKEEVRTAQAEEVWNINAGDVNGQCAGGLALKPGAGQRD